MASTTGTATKMFILFMILQALLAEAGFTFSGETLSEQVKDLNDPDANWIQKFSVLTGMLLDAGTAAFAVFLVADMPAILYIILGFPLVVLLIFAAIKLVNPLVR